jgi:tetratricopeptide (TPR) repeat protein
LARDYAAIGDGYFELKQYDKAEAYFSKASQLDPTLPINSYQLAKIFAEKGDYDRAIELTDDLLALEPENGVFLSLKAFCLYKSDKLDQAKIYLEKIIQSSPYSKDALFNLSLLAYANKDFSQAADYLSRLLEIEPSDGDATLLLARTEFLMEKPEKGFELLDAYNKLKPSDSAGLRLIAQKRYERREYSLSLQAYENLVAQDPSKGGDWFELSKLAMQAAENRERSLEALKRAFEAGYDKLDTVEAFITSLPESEREYYRALIPDSLIHPSPTPGSSPGQSAGGAPTPSPKA